MTPAVAGSFLRPAAAAAAARALRAAGHAVDAALPAPYPEVLAAVGGPPSRLGRATLLGALAGAAAGAGLAAGTSLAWPLATGGKAIVALPAVAVIAFEVAVLGGALATLAALALAARRGRGSPRLPAEVALAADRVVLLAEGGDPREAARILRAHGAEEVRRVA